MEREQCAQEKRKARRVHVERVQIVQGFRVRQARQVQRQAFVDVKRAGYRFVETQRCCCEHDEPRQRARAAHAIDTLDSGRL
jgi:hypothetical protein